MGKYLKMFVDRVEHVRTIENATTEELVAKIKQIGERIGIHVTESDRGPTLPSRKHTSLPHSHPIPQQKPNADN